jgi:hypothetical protein
MRASFIAPGFHKNNIESETICDWLRRAAISLFVRIRDIMEKTGIFVLNTNSAFYLVKTYSSLKHGFQ